MGISRWLRKLTASTNDLAVLEAIDEAPPCVIEDLPEDTTARIVGMVEPLDERRVVAPISQRSALGWGYAISSTDVATRRREVLPFALVDGVSRAIVDAEHANLLISATEFRKCHGVKGAPALLAPLLRNARATDPKPSLVTHTGKRTFKATYRFSEWVIEPGMLLAVVGRGVREHDPQASAGYREKRTLIRISGNAEHPLAITNEL